MDVVTAIGVIAPAIMMAAALVLVCMTSPLISETHARGSSR
jgi:hypothetical protein